MELSFRVFYQKKFHFVEKICEALVVYGLKRCLIIYPYNASGVIMTWLAAVIKINHEQLPYRKALSIEVTDNQSTGSCPVKMRR